MNNEKSLKQTLIEKFDAQMAIKTEAERKTAELAGKETEDRFTLFFGQKPETVDGMKAVFDGVTVTRTCGVVNSWAVVSFCPKCNKESNGQFRASVEGIGEDLKSDKLGVSNYCWSCNYNGAKVELSTDDKLLSILRDFISENCNCD